MKPNDNEKNGAGADGTIRLLAEIVKSARKIIDNGGDLKGAAKVMEECARSPESAKILFRKARYLKIASEERL
jgi:hypothetical protein